MTIVKRTDERAQRVEEKLAKNDGYCPCKTGQEPKNKCRCREFQMDCIQHDWYGTCHCGLWEKVKDSE